MQKNILLLITLTIFTPLRAHSLKKSHLDSNWYPTSAQPLTHALEKADRSAARRYNTTLAPSDIKAIIVPHAAYHYSGAVAASAYRLLDPAGIDNVIILAPAHFVSFSGVALPDFQTYQTPLSTLTVNTRAIKELARNELFQINSESFESEHSLEIQLPFLQFYLQKNITIVPLIVGAVTCEQASRIAQTLKKIITASTLIVVSSDFVHYGKDFQFAPFKEQVYYNLRALNSLAVEYIQLGLCAPFAAFIEQTKATICGQYPLQILLSLLEQTALGPVQPRLVAYDTSDKQARLVENNVSYISLLFTQQKLDMMPLEDQLTQQEKRSLVQEAADVLHNLFDTRIPEHLLYPIKSWGVMQPRGAFITLEKKKKMGMVRDAASQLLTTIGTKELRGCIGRIVTDEPLYASIATLTRDTALHDTRFAPVSKKELPELSLKISVLSVPKPIASYKEIVPGKHGVILRAGNRSAVFLPEVPVEFGWDLPTMLEQLSLKAGQEKDAWRDPKTHYEVFTTVNFGQELLD